MFFLRFGLATTCRLEHSSAVNLFSNFLSNIYAKSKTRQLFPNSANLWHRRSLLYIVTVIHWNISWSALVLGTYSQVTERIVAVSLQSLPWPLTWLVPSWLQVIFVAAQDCHLQHTMSTVATSQFYCPLTFLPRKRIYPSGHHTCRKKVCERFELFVSS